MIMEFGMDAWAGLMAAYTSSPGVALSSLRQNAHSSKMAM
jgi:hypothetical protein